MLSTVLLWMAVALLLWHVLGTVLWTLAMRGRAAITLDVGFVLLDIALLFGALVAHTLGR